MKQITIGFLGLGLIGGSIARSIRKNFPSCRIIVYSRRKNEDLLQGQKDGIISDITYSIDAHFSECDIIFLCAPVLQNIQFLEQLKPLINKTCIITDVGSVKGNIHKEVERLELESQFIGGHPMAARKRLVCRIPPKIYCRILLSSHSVQNDRRRKSSFSKENSLRNRCHLCYSRCRSSRRYYRRDQPRSTYCSRFACQYGPRK